MLSGSGSSVDGEGVSARSLNFRLPSRRRSRRARLCADYRQRADLPGPPSSFSRPPQPVARTFRARLLSSQSLQMLGRDDEVLELPRGTAHSAISRELCSYPFLQWVRPLAIDMDTRKDR